MSIDLQANTSVASRGSGLGTTSGNGTAVVWHRKSSSAAAGDLILELGMSGSTLRFSVGASDAVDYETGGGAQTPDNAATHADGTWGYYAIVVSGGAWAAYWYDDTGARTTIRASAWAGASTPNYVAIGDTNTIFGTGAQGQYRYLRMWNAALSDADLEAEFAATSAVRTSDLRGDWPLADSTDDSDSSGNGNTLTLSGTIGTSSEEPPIGQVETGTSGGLVVGSETSYVGEGFVGSIEAAGSSGTVYPVTRTSELLAQDAALRAVVRARLLGDALALAEDGLAESAYAVLLNEALALADEARSGTVRNRVALDTFALVDEQIAAVIGGGQIYVRTPFDTTGVVDELKRTWQAVRILGDTLTLSDEARLHRALERAVSEAFAPSDEALRWTLRNRIMQEAVEAGDDKQRIVAWQRQRDEAFTLADALVFHANRVRLSDETLSLVDSFIRQGSSSATLTDGIVLQDGALAPTVRPRLATDLATTVDELRFSRMHGRVIAELLTVDDKRNWLLYLSRLDAVNVSDSAVAVRSLVRALTEALTLGDSFIAAAAGVRVRVAEDAIEIDDGAVRVLIARRRVGDDVVLADPVIATSAGLRVRDMVDALGVTDTALAGAARGRVVQDLVTALYDQSVKGAARWRVLADALDPRDFTLKMLARTILLADTLDFDDGQINATLSVRALWDALELTDAYTKAVADALANVLDVRIVIDALRSPVALGSYNPVALGVARAPVLGGYN